MVTHQLQVERRTGKVRQSETDVLPLCHATNAPVRRTGNEYVELGNITTTVAAVESLHGGTSRPPCQRPQQQRPVGGGGRGTGNVLRRTVAARSITHPHHNHARPLSSLQYPVHRTIADISQTPPPQTNNDDVTLDHVHESRHFDLPLNPQIWTRPK